MKKDQCKSRVWSNSFYSHQCFRKPWKDGFCKQHHPDSVKERERKSQERYEEALKKSPWTRLARANERIAELEKEVASLQKFIAEKR